MHTHELAARAGVNPQTLRYYERRGLLDDPPRSASGYRAYPDEALGRMRFIKRAQGLGFTLGEISDLQAMRDALARLLDTCTRPHPERECPLLEAIATTGHVDEAGPPR